MENKRIYNRQIGLIAVILSGISVFLWFFTQKGYLSHFGINPTSKAIANICGLIGITLFSYSMVLATIYKKYEHFEYIYKPHHLIGKTAAFFMLIHPLLTSIRFFNRSIDGGLYFIFKDFEIPLLFGKVALFGTIILMLYALYIKTQPKLWIFIHRFFFLIFILAILHVTFLENDLNKNLFLKVYIFFLMYFTLGFVAYNNLIKKTTKKT